MLAQQRIRGLRHNSVRNKQTEEHRRQLAKETKEERSSRRNSNHQKSMGHSSKTGTVCSQQQEASTRKSELKELFKVGERC